MKSSPLPLASAMALLLGCTIHVETPRLTVRSMDFRGIDSNGLAFHVSFAAYNPNTFELALHDMNAQLYLENNPAGSSVTTLPVTLPPQREVTVDADVVVPWSGAPSYLLTAASQPMVNYTLSGTVRVEHYLSITTSFQYQGTMPRSFFLQ